MHRFFLPIFASLILHLTAAFSPALASPTEELEQTRQEIETAKSTDDKLGDDEKILTEKAEKLSAQMVETAKTLQESEEKLSSLEEKLRILGEQLKEKTDSLAARKKELSSMIRAAVKLSGTPQEAIILMPGNMLDNMKASRALKMTADGIKTQTESINAQMAELAALKEQVVKNQEEAVSEKTELEKQRELLKSQIAEHKQLQNKLAGERKKIKDKLRSLSKKASDLKSLIAAIEKEKAAEEERIQKEKEDKIRKLPAGEKDKLRSFKTAKGKMRPPAAGRLLQKYDASGSKGITIITRENARITAPFDGEVIFTGLFMEYGKLVIIRHSDGFHTLLAGMNKIDVSTGEFLLEGEPIGAMGDKEINNRLYLELRSNNQPVDPSAWISGF